MSKAPPVGSTVSHRCAAREAGGGYLAVAAAGPPDVVVPVGLLNGGDWWHSMKRSLHEETLLEGPMLLTILQVYVHLDRDATGSVTLSTLDKA